MKLRQIIESPIPDADSLNDFHHHSGSFSFKANTSKFKKKFDLIASGSSRIAFAAPIDVGWLKENDINKVNVVNGTAHTVIKLAKNSKGLFQNGEEMRIYEMAKRMGKERFLCPIIDWAGNPAYKNDIVYTISGAEDFEAKNGQRKVPFWIQFAMVNSVSEKAFKKLFNKQFGFVPEYSFTEYNYMNDSNEEAVKQAGDVYASACDKYHPTEEQEDNFADLLSLANAVFGTGIADLNNEENWGTIDGNLVIIDYGFSQDVQDLYGGHVTMSSQVVNNEITIEVEE